MTVTEFITRCTCIPALLVLGVLMIYGGFAVYPINNDIGISKILFGTVLLGGGIGWSIEFFLRIKKRWQEFSQELPGP